VAPAADARALRAPDTTALDLENISQVSGVRMRSKKVFAGTASMQLVAPTSVLHTPDVLGGYMM
jgi:hypothetical protein